MRNFQGLNDSQVQASRKQHGENTIKKKKRKSFIKSFFSNFGDPMLRILLLALGIQIVFVFNSGHWIETFGIAIAIFVAVTVATISEYSSETAFKKLQEQASAVEARVRRNGITMYIPATQIVVGDIVLVGSGEKVPADGIMLDGELEVDQSLLNGEPKEAKKHCVHARARGIDFLDPGAVFGGTVVTQGEAVIQVTSVGINTEHGKIAAELQEDTRTSPLKVKLERLAKVISVIGYIGAALVAISYFFNLLFIRNNFNMDLVMEDLTNWPFMFEHLLRAATLVVSVIVMAVPEGLPMMITVVLSTNMKHMLRDNVLVRKLNGIETAGSMNILFTDKTGTLTTGKLEVAGIITGDTNFIEAPSFTKANALSGLIATALIYNSQSEIDKNGKAIGGNSTDRILAQFAHGLGFQKNLEKTEQTPFNSKNKFMSTRLSDGRVLYKGAWEVLSGSLSKQYMANREVATFSDTHKQALQKKINELSRRAHRIITVAVDNTFICLVAIRDQVRPESVIAVRNLSRAQIQTVMITGDAKLTAEAVAREVGILAEEAQEVVLTSEELARMTDGELRGILPKLRVVARALPSDKSRLVRIAQEQGLVVGMTGDGVNDAPALKKADVGFAMGSGTEVAKEAGDVVILDDNIASIVGGVSYGRTIFKSIRKFLIFKLTINFCAITVSIVAPLLNVDTPITVIQMLWINLVMDTLAGLAFGGEKPRPEYMKEPPKKRSESIINNYMWGQIIITASFTAIISLWFLTSSYMDQLTHIRGTAYAMTIFFAFFMVINIFNSFNARSHDINIFKHIRTNRPFIWIMGIVTLVQFTMIYIGGTIFRTTPLDFIHLAVIVLLALSVFPVDLIRKLFLSGSERQTT